MMNIPTSAGDDGVFASETTTRSRHCVLCLCVKKEKNKFGVSKGNYVCLFVGKMALFETDGDTERKTTR